jgi:hypothetical protein
VRSTDVFLEDFREPDRNPRSRFLTLRHVCAAGRVLVSMDAEARVTKGERFTTV